MINAFSMCGMDFSMDEKGGGKGSEGIKGAVDRSSSQAHAYFLGLFQMWTTNCSLYISILV